MRDEHLDIEAPTRRQLLVGGALAAAAVAVGGARSADAGLIRPEAVAAVRVRPGLDVFPRSAWGADLKPKGRIYPETTRFLLVHHTGGISTARTTRNHIRVAYWWHTSQYKRWPDVCYQFFVGRAGDVWEGRKGSLDGPVRADASGGSQGWAQLVCLTGNFEKEKPTEAHVDSLVKVLAHIGLRDGLDLSPDATTTVVSRGSNKWQKGRRVTTPIINGHRSMSATTCPGKNLWNRLPEIRQRVADQAAAWS